MATYELTKTRLVAGVWEGVLTGAGPNEPTLAVTHQGAMVEGMTLQYDQAKDRWNVAVPIPANLIADGIQTFVISDTDGHTLASFALLSGDALAEDIRAELTLLRAELDLLKSAFRTHCSNS
jgi:hypothetical protein